MVELLVVVAVIGVLTATILPALSKAKQRGLQTRCMSNLKQIGIAIELFVNDNDETLPGPVWSGARASYDQTSSQELIWYIADFLDSQDPALVAPNKPVIAEVFVCPAYQRWAGPMIGRKCYVLNDNVGPDVEHRIRPFGYPPTSDNPQPTLPLRMGDLEALATPATTWAITDVDKLNVPINPDWWKDSPDRPIHGDVRNEMYFDWHVEAKRLDW